MSIGFLIMQIGDRELDDICEQVFVPALKECGLEAKRVDKHNRGDLLKSEIIRFIESADIIVADLTNERPNCYLEIGYAMGKGKFANLILTCRDDHRPDSPERKTDGPKVHFDLIGYDILFWQSDQLAAFREELAKRIRRRLRDPARASGSTEPSIDQQWLTTQREAALAGLQSSSFTASMEVHFGLLGETLSKRPAELLPAAESAVIQASGWPIAIVLRGNTDDRPKPTADGIVVEIKGAGALSGPSYDYWTLRRDGAFFLLRSLYEDRSNKEAIYFDDRIREVTEALLYCSRLYDRLGVPASTRVRMSVRHSGLEGRELLSSDPRRFMHKNRRATEDSVERSQEFALSEVKARLTELVKGFMGPVFELFEFCEFPDEVYSRIVDGFVKDAGAELSTESGLNDPS